MKLLPTLTLSALMALGTAISPANAQVNFSFGFGDYNYGRPCRWYDYHRMPAPRRCFGYFRSNYGGDVYADGDFVFRDRDQWMDWRDRDDYRRWQRRAYRHDQWNNNYNNNYNNGYNHY